MKRLVIGLVIAVLVAGAVSPSFLPAHSQTLPPIEPPAATEPAFLEPTPTAPAFVGEEPLPGAPDADPALGDEGAPNPEPAQPLAVAETTNVYLPLAIRQQPTQPPPGGGWNPGGPGWPMVAASPARTSWSSDQASSQLRVVWYRPIEAYISQNVQIIAANNLIYVSTARGLYALNPPNGQTVWRFDTKLPLGNSPTVINGVAYVGGHDRKLYALNASNGQLLWSYDGAGSGYDTNPLVVDGRVILGNRDGYMYAIGAAGTSRQGQLLWRFQTGGAIHQAAAYKDGQVFFASNDQYAYALDAASGGLIWKSQKLLGDGFQSYWPVVYQDKVIFTGSNGYRNGSDPGTRSVFGTDGSPFDSYNRMQRLDLFTTEAASSVIGPSMAAQAWSRGFPVVDASRVTEYYENKPDNSPNKHKPWRRTTFVLNIRNGSEFVFDSDRDGYMETIPQTYFGTNSGNRYPPIVGADGILYLNSQYDNNGDPKGRVFGWNLGTQLLSLVGLQGAMAEPQALSGGGANLYRSVCCDRVGSYVNINNGNPGQINLWSYNLDTLAPGYDDMWTVYPGYPRLHGFYKGVGSSVNGIYHNHGDQNPIIPYGGMLFSHRSNAIIALGSGGAVGKVDTLRIQTSTRAANPIGESELRARLETEIAKMIQAGHLRPGYYNHGTFMYNELRDYFENPGDTIYTLSVAYPYLSPTLQGQVRTYLQNEWRAYFDPTMYASIGWADGAAREAAVLPPEARASLGKYPKNQRSGGGFSWTYPPHNLYAMWKYTTVFPDQAGRAYDLAKTKLAVPLPSTATTEWLRSRPFELNAYIAGYIGFLRLQEAAGRTGTDAALRTQVTNELNRLYQLRVSIFTKDSPFGNDNYHKRALNVARNFIYLVPELGDYIYAADQVRWRTAIQEYDYVAPYWFVSRYEAMMNEGAMSPLYNAPAMFQAKAYILKESRAELTQYLDAPAFERGDLFYIQNLVAALQAR